MLNYAQALFKRRRHEPLPKVRQYEELIELLDGHHPVTLENKLLAFDCSYYAPDIVKAVLEYQPDLLLILLKNPTLATAVTSQYVVDVCRLSKQSKLRMHVAQDIELARSISVFEIVSWTKKFKDPELKDYLATSRELISALSPFDIEVFAKHNPRHIKKLWPTIKQCFEEIPSPRNHLWLSSILVKALSLSSFRSELEDDLYLITLFKSEAFLGHCPPDHLTIILENFPEFYPTILNTLERYKKSLVQEVKANGFQTRLIAASRSKAFRMFIVREQPGFALQALKFNLKCFDEFFVDPRFLRALSPKQIDELYYKRPDLRRTWYETMSLEEIFNFEERLKLDTSLNAEDYLQLAEYYEVKGNAGLSILCCKLIITLFDEQAKVAPLLISYSYLMANNFDLALKWFKLATHFLDPSDLLKIIDQLHQHIPEDHPSFHEIKTLEETLKLTKELNFDQEENQLIERFTALNLCSSNAEYDQELNEAYQKHREQNRPILYRHHSSECLLRPPPTTRSAEEVAAPFLTSMMEL